HARALADGFQAFEDLDAALTIGDARCRADGGVCSLLGGVIGSVLLVAHRFVTLIGADLGTALALLETLKRAAARSRSCGSKGPIHMRIGITTYLKPDCSGT